MSHGHQTDTIRVGTSNRTCELSGEDVVSSSTVCVLSVCASIAPCTCTYRCKSCVMIEFLIRETWPLDKLAKA